MTKRAAVLSNSLDGSFAKARYEYCLQLYKSEQERKELLEKKAQFYLSLVTLFFGALVLKMDFVTEISGVLAKYYSLRLAIVLYVASGVFFD